MTTLSHALETIALRKEYPGTVALRDVSLQFHGGSIHALLGKNGAGKSTLLRIFAGAVQPTGGEVLVDGTPVHFRSPHEALRHGVAAVHQELSVIPGLSVAENILLGRLPKNRFGLIDWEEARARAAAILSDLGVRMDVRATVGRLGIAHQQMVEIAKAMAHTPSVLMLDEPTSALAHHESENLFTLLRALAAKGIVLLYITHRLEEIRAVADTVTVLRDGRSVGTLGVREATPPVIVRMMFGDVLRKSRPPATAVRTAPALTVRGFSRHGAFEDVSFTLFKGEVLGIAGVLGSGRTELLRALFGADPHESGTVALEGRTVSPASPAQMKRLGLALAPENRKEEGVIQLLSTRINLCLARLTCGPALSVTTAARERVLALRTIRDLDIALPSPDTAVANLSGGNQQKVVIGKWMNTGPRIMLLDEPTRGIDLQAKEQIFQIIWDLSARGISCLVVSSELEELMAICHRVLIMKKGRIVGEMLPQESTLERLFAACMD